ncbi:MAG TPA: YcxB family protein [Syntrophomonadaceae bacterium]|nr:YcxB family protein [Syntrophomonadaceae bacterium]
MTVKYELTLEDYLDFNIYHVMQSKTARQALLVQRIMVAMIFVALPLVINRIVGIDLKTWMPMSLFMAVLAFLFYRNFFEANIKKNLVKILAEGSPAGIIGRHKISFDEEEIVERNERGKATISWSNVEKFAENGQSFFLYYSPENAYIIPFRAFRDPAHREEFIDMVERYLPARSRLNKE